jgi:seryl-tRNA synthetase
MSLLLKTDATQFHFSKNQTMTQEEINQISASFYRMMFLVKMIETEQSYFLKYSRNGGIKNVLKRLKDSNEKGVEHLLSYMPNSKDKFKSIMAESEEKINAMANIIEKLSMLDEDTVLKLEDDFNQHIKVVY